MYICLIVSLSRDLAMSIGGEKRMETIRRNAFIRFADECGINPRLVLSRLDGIASKIVTAAESMAAELSRTFPSPVYDHILAVVRAHCAQIGG